MQTNVIERKRAKHVGALLAALTLVFASRALPPSCWAQETEAMSATPDSMRGPVDSLLASIQDDSLRFFATEVLAKNPGIAAQAAAARAVAQREAQASAFPDPMLGATAWVLNPESRVGPQQVTASLSQQLPWFGKRKLRGQVADFEAQAARAKLDALRLQRLTQARRLYYELAFLELYEQVVQEDRATLVHYEELARARYASGVGLEQAVVRIQAEITKAEVRLLEIDTRRVGLLAEVNALRDQPATTSLGLSPLPRFPEFEPDPATLHELALLRRPEIDASDAMVERWRAGTGLAKKESKPNLTLGVTYTFVGERTDPAGRASPPPDNGQDALGIVAGINVPLWRGKYGAAVDETTLEESKAREDRREVIAGIERELGNLTQQLPLTADRLRLLEGVMDIQARQSLQSAESGYAAGTLNALDLLDAERVLLDVRIAAARARADYAIALAQLEGAVAAPLSGNP